MNRDVSDRQPPAGVESGVVPPVRVPDEPMAPVATERGMFGEPPPVVDVRDLLDEPGDVAGRRLLLWVVGALLTAAAALWLAVLSVAQVTDEQVALPALERGVAALTDLDALLDEQLEAVQKQADAGADTLTPPGFPIRDTMVQTREVRREDRVIDRPGLRDELLRIGASRVYTRGVSAFQQGEASPQQSSRLSPSGGIRALLDGLSRDNHGTAVVWLWPLGAACLLLGALLLAAGAGFGRFLALGAALVLAAVPVLLAGLAARLAFGFVDAGPDDRLLEEFLAIGRQLAALPVRNALWLGAAGVAIALPAALLGALFNHSVRHSTPGEEPVL